MCSSGWGSMNCVASWPSCVGGNISGLAIGQVPGVEKDKACPVQTWFMIMSCTMVGPPSQFRTFSKKSKVTY